MGATYDLASFATRRRVESSPNTEAVARTLVDTIGVAIAGMSEDASRILLDWIRDEPAKGRARIWGTHIEVAPSQAAMANGTAAHALDWDDAVPSMPMHPGAALVPALLGQTATLRASGTELVHAYDVGSAVCHAVSDVLPVNIHYGRGWHNTATSGRLAAVAALAHLMRLDETTTCHALGIVSSSAAGSLANFGTMTKSLHAGAIARDAIMSVELAQRGYTANTGQLEAPMGFFSLFGEASDLEALPERLMYWERAWTDDWALKRYPSCYATHHAVDAALAVEVHHDDIKSVVVSVPEKSMAPLRLETPHTGLEGKFSLAYTVARALVTGIPTPGDFTNEAVHDRAVRRVMDVVALDRRDPAGAGAHTRIDVERTDGTILRSEATVAYGDAQNPLSDGDLEAKYLSALAYAGWTSARSAELLFHLRAAPRSDDLAWIQDALRA